MFLHPGCLSEDAALTLVQDLRAEFPDLKIQIRALPDGAERAKKLGIVTMPAFVLDGRLISVGVPRKTWLEQKIRDSNGGA